MSGVERTFDKDGMKKWAEERYREIAGFLLTTATSHQLLILTRLTTSYRGILICTLTASADPNLIVKFQIVILENVIST